MSDGLCYRCRAPYSSSECIDDQGHLVVPHSGLVVEFLEEAARDAKAYGQPYEWTLAYLMKLAPPAAFDNGYHLRAVVEHILGERESWQGTT